MNPPDPREQEAAQRRAWFAAAEIGDVAAMATVLAQQPQLVDATTRLQVLYLRSNCALFIASRTDQSVVIGLF